MSNLLPEVFNFTGKRRIRQNRTFDALLGLPTVLGSLVGHSFKMIAKHKENNSLLTVDCLYTSDTVRYLNLLCTPDALLSLGNYKYELTVDNITWLEGELQLSESIF